MSKPIRAVFAILFISYTTGACLRSGAAFHPISGFSHETNTAIEKFLKETSTVEGRKVSVFDGDGTVFGQVPHYMADECLYQHAKAHPERKPEIISRMKPKSNVSLPYVQDRVHYLSGMKLDEIRALGKSCYQKDYTGKMYPQMKELTSLLKKNGFEVWVITASPEGLYQGFISEALDIPITNVVGVKSIVHGGVVTDRIVDPVPQDEGKKEAIETFVQAVPLFAGGNSRGDKEMIESSSGIRMIINPDEHVQEGEKESIADYAKRQNWLVERIRDVEEPGFPAVSSKDFGVRRNKSHEGPK